MQQVIADFDGTFRTLDLPERNTLIWPGLKWGGFDEPLSPAFWASQAWMAAPADGRDYRLGDNLAEEVIYCVLGGHGMPAEVGLAAARRTCEALRRERCQTLSQSALERLLREPLAVNGRLVRYRFAAQRARYLAAILTGLKAIDDARLADSELRNALCALPGIGPKTASWVVRNRRASDCVAILDVHVVRACSIIGVFPHGADPARRYFDLEGRFLRFCDAVGARASAMDAAMWSTMRRLSRPLMEQLVDASHHFAQPQPAESAGKPSCRVATGQETTRRAQAARA